jgi:polar amino acid transport system permease protein
MITELYYLLAESGPLLLKGLGMTLLLWFGSALLSFVIGVPLGILNCTRLRMPHVAFFVDWYIFLVRGIPVYVHVLLAYFVLPDILNITLSPIYAAILALGVCSSGYVAEIIRAGINSLPSGQWDACFVLGYSRWQSLRSVILPQMMCNILPALCNELESLIKSTSILAAIGVLELTKVGTNIVARTMNPVPVYILLALLYLLLSAVLRVISYYGERKISYARN